VTRDAAFIVSEIIEADKMLNIVCEQKEDLLENVSIFDVYKGKGLEEGTKSLGLRFAYRVSNRTLTDSEVNSVHERIVQKTLSLTGAKIRA